MRSSVNAHVYVTKYRYCDFVVWTTQSIHIECVHLDGKLLENVLQNVKHFFLHCILPEILSKWYSGKHIIAIAAIDSDNRKADDEDNGSWCYCKEDIAGEI